MNKRLFIGVDEAGYGPNLGPLLIGGSAWLAPASMSETELCHALSESFRAETWKPNCGHVPLGDSKKLYQPGSGLVPLEAGVLAMMDSLPNPASGCRTLNALIEATSNHRHVSSLPPWYDDLKRFSVPKTDSHIANPLLDGTEVKRLSAIAKLSLAAHDIQLLDLQCVIVTEPEFNAQVNRLGSKGQLLSSTTLNLVAELIQKHEGYPIEVFCDRQGGRKNYLPVLLDAMPDAWFTETQSSNQRCSYRSTLGPSCGIHFSVGGDSFPPTALASMLAKYIRERCMEAFNDFWRTHAPDLRPTAGYPLDAKRFRTEIEAIAQTLNLSLESWWRCR